MDKVQVLCMCMSFDCAKSVYLELPEALKVNQPGLVLIVEGCEVGPESTDVPVSKHEGYSLYREG